MPFYTTFIFSLFVSFFPFLSVQGFYLCLTHFLFTFPTVALSFALLYFSHNFLYPSLSLSLSLWAPHLRVRVSSDLSLKKTAPLF